MWGEGLHQRRCHSQGGAPGPGNRTEEARSTLAPSTADDPLYLLFLQSVHFNILTVRIFTEHLPGALGSVLLTD